MPLYEYRCKSCGEEFEALRSLHDDDRELECPRCKDKNAERRFSLPAFDSKSGKGSCGGGNRAWRFG